MFNKVKESGAGQHQSPTLAELGLDKKTSMVAQQLAGMPEETRHAIAGCLRSFCMPILPYHSCRGDEDAGPRKINDLRTVTQSLF